MIISGGSGGTSLAPVRFRRPPEAVLVTTGSGEGLSVSRMFFERALLFHHNTRGSPMFSPAAALISL
jgi:hypothetical protein